MPTREMMERLGQEIICSYEDRSKRIAEIRTGVNARLKELDAAHEAMGKELRANLTKSRFVLREAEKKRRSQARESRESRRKMMAAQLKGWAEDRKAAAEKAGAQRKKDVAEIREKASSLRKGFREELAGVREEWRKQLSAIQAKKKAIIVSTEAPPKVELEERVFEYLANHPDGTRLAELEREFGVPRIQMAKIIRSLMEQGKVRKEDLLYFAV